MATFIKLTRVVTGRDAAFVDSDDPTENHGSPRSHAVFINPESIRCFYPRHENRPGTRITFMDGGGFAVAEPVDLVAVMADGEATPPARASRA